jgi:methionine aminotransferase
MNKPLSIDSKLPDVGTTIFTEMSLLAQTHGAINLSQGFPDFNPPQPLIDRLSYHLNQQHNQYAPMSGLPALRQQLAIKIERWYQRQVDYDEEITVVPGATAALFCAIQAVVNPGDEVIVFDPSYDSYDPAVTLAGGRCIHLPLQTPDYSIDWQLTADAISSKTRLVIINSPHNPTGTVLQYKDLLTLQSLLRDTRVLVLSDEVYEHLVFDQRQHASVLHLDELYTRSFAVYSFGKTYHATGWKTGYCVAPRPLMREFRKVHQYLTFVAVTPIQHALADFMASDPDYLLQLADFYQHKRDYFCTGLAASRFSFTPAQGSYFQLADFSAISDLDERTFCHQLTTKSGVAAIPLQPFYQQSTAGSQLRFCFAKSDKTLQQALEKLCRL